ncbi:hypothetical protein [Vibrio tubiashii]|uniref:hypothetical protein n=1 Tax=Vibrio tubiashii TaxID=29498 RepID=UPI00349EF421
MSKRNIVILLLSLLSVILLLTVVPYIWNFRDSPLSSETSDWGAFGSYISGVLGPALSFGSILAVFLVSRREIEAASQKAKEDNQELRNAMSIDRELKVFDEVYNTMMNLIFTKVSSELLINDITYIKAVMKKDGILELPTYQPNGSINTLRFIYKGKPKYLHYSKEERVFDLLYQYVDALGEDTAQKLLKENAEGFLRFIVNDLKSASQHLIIMLLSADRLNSLGYKSLLLKYKFTNLSECAMLLGKVGLLENHVLSLLSFYWSQPDHTNNRMGIPNSVKDNMLSIIASQHPNDDLGDPDSWTFTFNQERAQPRGILETTYILKKGSVTYSYDSSGVHKQNANTK